MAVRDLDIPEGPVPGQPAPRRRLVTISVVIAAVTVLAIGLVFSIGGTADGADGAGPTGGLLGHWAPATRFLLAVAVVILATHLVGAVLTRCGQPAVVGEILAGLLLGPSLLGAVSPDAWAWLFSTEVVGALEMAAQLGLVAFMFLLGCELRPVRLPGAKALAATLSSANLAIPFVCTLPVAALLYTGHAGEAATPASFVLFLGLAVSVTALPVLGRILQDRGLVDTPTGSLALTTAVISDVVAWGTLALVLAVAGTVSGGDALLTVLLAGVFTAVMVLLVRPALAMLVRYCEAGRISEATLLAVVLGGSIGASISTQLLGVHAIFGAFLFGAAMPRNSPVVRRIDDRISGVTVAVLLPLFFANVGLQTSVSTFGTSASAWFVLAGVLTVATGAKLFGVGLAARAAGMPPLRALSLGVLMNCRGLTELVIADVGFRNGIIDRYVFTVLVLTALITTGLTGPLLGGVERLARRRSWPAEPATPVEEASVR